MKDQPIKSIKYKRCIDYLTYQINFLRDKVDICDESNKTYNRLIIERARIRQQLKEVQNKNIVSFLFKKLEPRPKEKRICDYFKK